MVLIADLLPSCGLSCVPQCAAPRRSDGRTHRKLSLSSCRDRDVRPPLQTIDGPVLVFTVQTLRCLVTGDGAVVILCDLCRR
ncbi:hypothetical protein INR49_014517 [Caranx melampygus]|nr:hypothetical protein INR49_014517 [Caranx melampygus]